MLIALAVFLLAGRLFPPPPQPAKPLPGAVAPGKDAKDKADPNAAAPAADAKKTDQAEVENAPQAPPAPGDLPAVVSSAIPTQYVALGSVDPKSGYRMLVTLSNAGAAVVRAEMSSPRYRDQEDWNGYLGDLELKTVAGGVQVQVAGAGTPAANTRGGRDFVTTDPAPTTLPSPIVTPRRTITRVPNQTSRSIRTGADLVSAPPMP